MSGIQAFRIGPLKNDVLTGFMTDVERITKCGLSVGEQGLLEPFSKALREYVDTLRQTNDVYGERIREADALVDRAWSVMNAQCGAFCDHPNAERREAGKAVRAIFDRYANPTDLPYVEEYGIMEKLLSDLNEIDSAVLARIAMDEWVIELNKRVEAFNKLRHEKTESKAAVEPGAVRRVRQTLETAYKTLITQLNGLVALFPDEAHTKIANELNTYINSCRTVDKAQKSVKASAATKAE